MSEALPQVTIYTDGGADPNPGPGGWGAVLLFEKADGSSITKELSGGHPATTNNQMELSAAIEALNALSRPCSVDLHTDSQYLRNGITRWIHGWKAKGWKDVKNVALWQALDAAIQRHQIAWHWVKGHAGNIYNERADQLATAARPVAAVSLDESRAQLYLQLAGPTNNKKSGAGGWAAALIRPQDNSPAYFVGEFTDTSPNELAVRAAVALLQQIPPEERLQVYCDNSYLIDGISQWVQGWRSQGWSKDIKFKGDWQQLDSLNQARDIHWVRGKIDNEQLSKKLKKMAQERRQLAGD